ncbi:winged helix-turn-helix domain-containing protein [Kitasatospora sp. NPDC048298]|uniref:helix-turn-helix domain-containing protein n=1 Tax=Kitasatospora sp. NPDC048298 TaxID=3364049 RepID=UPI0037207746
MAAELLFTAGDLARMRFAVSPMWEVGPSLRLLRSGLAHPVHRPWTEQVRPRLAALGPAYALLAELARRTGLSASAVSQYLTALREARLVSAHRAGRWVLYARTASAEALLAPPAPLGEG